MATDPEWGGGGGGFAARISGKIRPQDPPGGGGGRGCITDSCSPGCSGYGSYEQIVSAVMEPQSVPSRISVVLVEEDKVWFPHWWIRTHDCWPTWRIRPV